MALYTKVKKHFYQDSLKLMNISNKISKLEGINQAFAFMATEINVKARIQVEFVSDEIKVAEADDLVLLVDSEDHELAMKALEDFDNRITGYLPNNNKKNDEEFLPATFEEGFFLLPANLSVISVPGTYAVPLAMNALYLGMNVHMFSDNVSVEDEILIKELAEKRELIVMGPDCGTSIISGLPICFANKVHQGNIGVIGSSGTGLQEFTSLLDTAGFGITHAIGTGGRDLSKEVAGRSTLTAINLLNNDPETEMVVIVSKSPSKTSEEIIIEAVKKMDKPCILAFLGSNSQKLSPCVYTAGTIEEAVAKTVALCKKEDPLKAKFLYERIPLNEDMFEKIMKLSKTQKHVKGLYTGGSLANEAKFVLKENGKNIIDLGDDKYTRGRVHPMIDPSIRTSFVIEAFEDPETAVLLCDVVIGYGSHKDPAGSLVQDVIKAREKTNADVVVIASITGTDSDPQNKNEQIKKLKDAGIWVFPSNQYAAEISAEIIKLLKRGIQP